MAQSDVPVTKLGGYGDNATPTPATYTDTASYTARTISFHASAGSDPAYLFDVLRRFVRHKNRPVSDLRTLGDALERVDNPGRDDDRRHGIGPDRSEIRIRRLLDRLAFRG